MTRPRPPLRRPDLNHQERRAKRLAQAEKAYAQVRAIRMRASEGECIATTYFSGTPSAAIHRVAVGDSPLVTGRIAGLDHRPEGRCFGFGGESGALFAIRNLSIGKALGQHQTIGAAATTSK